jgi:hypothetical protein
MWSTVWDHPKNSSLKTLRKTTKTLFPGDIVHIPDLVERRESCATEAKHTFRKLGEKCKLQLTLMKEADPSEEKDEDSSADYSELVEAKVPSGPPVPDAGVKYSLYIDKVHITSSETDSDGRFSEEIPADAKTGKLVLNQGQAIERTINLNLGQMDPLDELQGACKRLFNLGYPCPINKNEYNDEIRFAIQCFQRDNELTVSGEMDSATTDKLKEVFGW